MPSTVEPRQAQPTSTHTRGDTPDIDLHGHLHPSTPPPLGGSVRRPPPPYIGELPWVLLVPPASVQLDFSCSASNLLFRHSPLLPRDLFRHSPMQPPDATLTSHHHAPAPHLQGTSCMPLRTSMSEWMPTKRPSSLPTTAPTLSSAATPRPSSWPLLDFHSGCLLTASRLCLWTLPRTPHHHPLWAR